VSAELKETLRWSTQIFDHRLNRSAFVAITEEVLGEEKLPDLEPVSVFRLTSSFLDLPGRQNSKYQSYGPMQHRE
jgi:hypothetical protein